MGVEPILPPVRPHAQYVCFVKQGCIGIKEPCRHQHVKQELLLLDLAALRPLLGHLYSATVDAGCQVGHCPG